MKKKEEKDDNRVTPTKRETGQKTKAFGVGVVGVQTQTHTQKIKNQKEKN